jgi:hypothetical protein
MQKQSASSRTEFWRQVVTRQRASGLSIYRFCSSEGLAAATFFAWKRRLGQGDGGGRPVPAVNFAPVQIVTEDLGGAAEGATGTIEILLPQERRIRLTGRVDREQLAHVLAALQG